MAAMNAKQRAPHMRRLWEWQNGQCAACRIGMPHPDQRRESGAPVMGNAPTLDHYRPRVAGGSNALENLLLVCSQCNFRRGDSAPSKRLQAMKREIEPLVTAWRTGG